jgi:hypothetical protein
MEKGHCGHLPAKSVMEADDSDSPPRESGKSGALSVRRACTDLAGVRVIDRCHVAAVTPVGMGTNGIDEPAISQEAGLHLVHAAPKLG